MWLTETENGTGRTVKYRPLPMMVEEGHGRDKICHYVYERDDGTLFCTGGYGWIKLPRDGWETPCHRICDTDIDGKGTKEYWYVAHLNTPATHKYTIDWYADNKTRVGVEHMWTRMFDPYDYEGKPYKSIFYLYSQHSDDGTLKQVDALPGKPRVSTFQPEGWV